MYRPIGAIGVQEMGNHFYTSLKFDVICGVVILGCERRTVYAKMNCYALH